VRKTEIRDIEHPILALRAASATQHASDSGHLMSRASPTMPSYLSSGLLSAGLPYVGEVSTVMKSDASSSNSAPGSVSGPISGSSLENVGSLPSRARYTSRSDLVTVLPPENESEHSLHMTTPFKSLLLQRDTLSVCNNGQQPWNWFLTRPSNVSYGQSARSDGKQPMANLIGHQLEHYRAVRRRVVQKNAERFDLSAALRHLADPSYIRDDYYRITCQLCGAEEIKSQQGTHYCSDQDGDQLPRASERSKVAKSTTLWKIRIIYPHDVVDFYEEQGSSDVENLIFNDDEVKSEDVLAILVREEKNLLNVLKRWTGLVKRIRKELAVSLA
ncbi:hypothetical protein BGX28_000460, partial [Mortierella sp. GBA30]